MNTKIEDGKAADGDWTNIRGGGTAEAQKASVFGDGSESGCHGLETATAKHAAGHVLLNYYRQNVTFGVFFVPPRSPPT